MGFEMLLQEERVNNVCKLARCVWHQRSCTFSPRSSEGQTLLLLLLHPTDCFATSFAIASSVEIRRGPSFTSIRRSGS